MLGCKIPGQYTGSTSCTRKEINRIATQQRDVFGAETFFLLADLLINRLSLTVRLMIT
jgi:hypothetical protein